LEAHRLRLLRRAGQERDRDFAVRAVDQQSQDRAGRIPHREVAARRRAHLDVRAEHRGARDGKRAGECERDGPLRKRVRFMGDS
jgi:hypothetical protein